MSEKLTPLMAHLTRRRVPVYLVNSHSHTRVVHRTRSRPSDVGIERRSARMSGTRPGATPIPATLPLIASPLGPQHLPRHAGILEEIIAGRVVRSLRPGFVAGR